VAECLTSPELKSQFCKKKKKKKPERKQKPLGVKSGGEGCLKVRHEFPGLSDVLGCI
jgi:hypothetical protein